MNELGTPPPLRVYSTSPQSKDVERGRYLDHVADIARWSEAAGCEGILVYTDNGLVDPWLTSRAIIGATDHLCPLVAIQPVYMHPYTVAKMVTSLAFMHDRAVHLNLLAGGFKNDLVALGDDTPHDDRYLRTTEYGRIVLDLLRGEGPVTATGKYYDVKGLRLAPELPEHLMPTVLVSGSSPAGLAAAHELGAIPVKYPKPPGEEDPSDGLPFGVRVGIIARDDADEAWRVADERFPPDRKGELAHKLAMSVSDSHWHKQLSERDAAESRDTYWLHPFQTYKTFCPYLVGDHPTIAAEIRRYRAIGADTVILDIPPAEEELAEIRTVFELAASDSH